MADVNVKRVGVGTPERRQLLYGKTGHPDRLSLAEACEAEVRKLPLVLIGGILLYGKTGHPARLSLAEACEAEVRKLPLVLIGGILPPGGSDVIAALRKARTSCQTCSAPILLP